MKYQQARNLASAVAIVVGACGAGAMGQDAPAREGMEKVADGVIVRTAGGMLKVEVDAPDIVRIAFAADRAFFDRATFATAVKHETPAKWSVNRTAAGTVLSTEKLQVRVDGRTGAVTFLDLAGKTILAETPGGREMAAASVLGESTHHVRQQWAGDAEESLYGLGQHQNGWVDIKGRDLELWQHNTEIAVPFLVSSKGYGVLWENPSYTKFGDPREYVAIPVDHLTDVSGKAGGFTRTAYADRAMQHVASVAVEERIENGDPTHPGTAKKVPGEAAVVWEGDVRADGAGDYPFELFANGGVKMWIDGEMVADHWRQNWLPWDELARGHFAEGSTHHLKVQWVKDGCDYCTLKWKPPVEGEVGVTGNTSLWSQVGDGVDYYFVYGPSLDRVVAGYRQLTGKAPMMPAWAFGLWQSRQRYKTQQESVEVVKGFRGRGIPFDNIVQDWMYWKEDSWGSHEFDPARFPDSEGWIKEIHELHAHLMVSVWGKFYPTVENFKAMEAGGFLYPVDPTIKDWVGPGYRYTFYDAFNPAGRKLFWEQVKERLFVKGVDAWWMDATEPDLLPSPPTLVLQQEHMAKTAAGSGARVLNAYPLLNSEGVYEGQRAAAPDQRVFILTRSGYAGQQRYAAANWSGDISSTWTAMKKQIAAGLGYSISGLPYWTMDCGGFAVPPWFDEKRMTKGAREEWGELNARWFEFATFVPLLRVHGEALDREMWAFGEGSDSYKAQLKFDRLRYRLLPYVYSLAGDVTERDGTFLRPLVMDFAGDKTARSLNDEFLFGPAFLVSPVTTFGARSRSVYLPAGTWYDLWSGAAVEGGRTIDARAPYDAMPVHVRAGSIVPLGPEMQYTGERPVDPLTVYVYTGRDGEFSLYEDDGVTNGYERGERARIPFRWNEQAGQLTIGKREGAFPGMLTARTVRVVFVSKERAVGIEAATQGIAVSYRGDEVQVRR